MLKYIFKTVSVVLIVCFTLSQSVYASTVPYTEDPTGQNVRVKSVSADGTEGVNTEESVPAPGVEDTLPSSTDFLNDNSPLSLSNPDDVVPADNLNTSDISILPGNPRMIPIAPSSANVNVSETKRGITLNYNTLSDGWAGGGFCYDDFGTPEVETQDLSGLDSLILGIKADTSQVKLEVVDGSNARAILYLTDIVSNAEQVYEVAIEELQSRGVDVSNVLGIYFIVEGVNKEGTLEINSVPLVTPSQAYSVEDINVPGVPKDCLVAPAEATVSVQTNGRSMEFQYNTGSAGWAGCGLKYVDYVRDYHRYINPESTADLSALSNLVFGLKGNPTQVKFEVIDDQGRKGHVYIEGISDQEERVYSISTANLANTGVDISRIRMMLFLVEGVNNEGTLTINKYTPGDLRIPDGWTQAETNPNYAFLVSKHPNSGRAADPYLLHLIDLRTLKVNVIGEQYPGAGDTRLFGYDVSPEDTVGGPVTIHTVFNEYLEEGTYKTYIKRIGNPDEFIVIAEGSRDAQDHAQKDIVNIEISSKLAIIHRADGSKHFVDLETLRGVVQPEGFRKSELNPEYYYKIKREPLSRNRYVDTILLWHPSYEDGPRVVSHVGKRGKLKLILQHIISEKQKTDNWPPVSQKVPKGFKEHKQLKGYYIKLVPHKDNKSTVDLWVWHRTFTDGPQKRATTVRNRSLSWVIGHVITSLQRTGDYPPCDQPKPKGYRKVAKHRDYYFKLEREKVARGVVVYNLMVWHPSFEDGPRKVAVLGNLNKRTTKQIFNHVLNSVIPHETVEPEPDPQTATPPKDYKAHETYPGYYYKVVKARNRTFYDIWVWHRSFTDGPRMMTSVTERSVNWAIGYVIGSSISHGIWPQPDPVA